MKTILFLDFDGVLHPNLAPEDGCFVRAPALAKMAASCARLRWLS